MAGMILRNIRKLNKLRQIDIADKLKVAENTVSNYETEYSNITFETAINFIQGCNFDIQLINKEDNKIYKLEEFDTVDKKC